jgi:hypothetical protein
MPTFPPGAAARGTHAAAVANRETRRAFDAELLPEIVRLRNQGLSHRRIAEALEYLGFATRRGGCWDGTTMRRILERARANEGGESSTAPGPVGHDGAGQYSEESEAAPGSTEHPGAGHAPADDATVPEEGEAQPEQLPVMDLHTPPSPGETIPDCTYQAAGEGEAVSESVHHHGVQQGQGDDATIPDIPEWLRRELAFHGIR